METTNPRVEQVRERYADVARRAAGTATEEKAEKACCGTSCCGGSADAETIARGLGYSEADLETEGEGNLGLGYGNPHALAAIRPGQTVLDLGRGAGFVALLAADHGGPIGHVID